MDPVSCKDVDVVIAFAKGKKLSALTVIDGSRVPYTKELLDVKMSAKANCLGLAGNLFWLDLKSFVIGTAPSLDEVAATIKDEFTPEHILERPPWELFKLPVGIAAVGGKVGPQDFSWRKISMDKQVYAFVRQFAKWAKMPEKGEMGATRKKMLDNMCLAARHLPIDIYLVDSVDAEKKIFSLSFQIMEDFRKGEEKHAPSGWFMCKVVHQAELVAGSGKGQSMFDEVSFAQKSEYKASVRAVQTSKCYCFNH